MATREKKFHSIIDLENVNGDDAENNVKRKAGSKGLPPELLTAISKLPKKTLSLSLHGPLPHCTTDVLPYDLPSEKLPQEQSYEQIFSNRKNSNIVLFQKTSLLSTSAVTSIIIQADSRNSTKVVCSDL